MAIKKRLIALRIIFSILLIILLLVGGVIIWLSYNYKQVILTRVPAMIAKSSDSVYHMSMQDISINIFKSNATITGLKIWPDKAQAKALRARQKHIPTTLSTVNLPLAEIYGISWLDLITNRSFNCDQVVVHQLKWLMEAEPHPEDSSFPARQKQKPMIGRITATHANVLQPDITYKYEGKKTHFSGMLKGGTGALEHFVYDNDQTKDTSNFLYAHSGVVRPDSFIFIKTGSRYTVRKPKVDFETAPRQITLKAVKIDHLTDMNEESGKIQEIYNLDFPLIDIDGLNWNKLINDGLLTATVINAARPVIDIHYISSSATPHSKMGDYPNQQLHQVGLKTNIGMLSMKDGLSVIQSLMINLARKE